MGQALTVVPATEEHAETLAPLLREADLREIEARSPGLDPEVALKIGLTGVSCLTAQDKLGPVLMFGVGQGPTEDTGFIWMMGSDRIHEHRSQFIRECKSYFNAFHQLYPVLTNVVHDENTVHVRWLKWLGCRFIEPVQFGQELFWRFVSIRDV